MRRTASISGMWFAHEDKDLERLRADGFGDYADRILARSAAAVENPMRYFVAHGVGWSDKPRECANGKLVIPPRPYPAEYKNDGVAFLNDYESDIPVMMGPNQQGKSYILAMWTALRVVKCDPKWECFAENGLICPEWKGPKTWVVASYSWDNVDTIWRTLQCVLPRYEIGAYAIGGNKDLSFGDGKPKRLRLACGSVLKFLCYTQSQMHWEGFSCDGGSGDEQTPKEKWVGMNRGTTTRGDYTPYGMALTGHILDDRPDTGTAGWIYRELYRGEQTMGKKVTFYYLSVPTTATVVLGDKKKHGLWLQWVDPGSPRSTKDERAAVARYHGGWEEGSGLVFDSDVWQRRVHVINPLWDDGRAPPDLTKWRSIDYGSESGVNACGFYAVGPLRVMMRDKPDLLERVPEHCRDDIVCVRYRLIYQRGLEIADFVKLIIELSHNEQRLVSRQKDDRTGNTYEYFDEIYTGEMFHGGTLLDPRSAKQGQQGQTLEVIFSRYGLKSIRPACGQHDAQQIPRLKDMLRIDYTKTHPFLRDAEGTPEKGRPFLFFFDNGGGEDISEIEAAEKPPRRDGRQVRGVISTRCQTHAIDELKYFASDDPKYMGDFGPWRDGIGERELVTTGRALTPFTKA